MKIAAWAENLAAPIKSIEDWAALVETQVKAAKDQGAEVFLMPEYAGAHWLHLIPRGLPGSEQLNRLAAFAPEAIRHMAGPGGKYQLLVVSRPVSGPRPGTRP